MNPSRQHGPPLSPVLLAGFVLPPPPPQPLLDVVMAVARRRHPGLLDRLEPLGEARLLIDPVDLPFAFLLELGAASPRLAIVPRKDELEPFTAVVRGPLLLLLDVLQGRVDGDAIFFSRSLAIEGDTEAVLVLRNALDNEEIDLAEDLLSLLGPLRLPARRMLGAAGALFGRAARDLETLRAAFVGPLVLRDERRNAELRDLEAEVARLTRRLRRVDAANRPGTPDGSGRP